MDGHRLDTVEAQNSAYRFARPNLFSGLDVAKDRDETQALTRGISKVNTREEKAPQLA